MEIHKWGFKIMIKNFFNNIWSGLKTIYIVFKIRRR